MLFLIDFIEHFAFISGNLSQLNQSWKKMKCEKCKGLNTFYTHCIYIQNTQNILFVITEISGPQFILLLKRKHCWKCDRIHRVCNCLLLTNKTLNCRSKEIFVYFSSLCMHWKWRDNNYLFNGRYDKDVIGTCQSHSFQNYLEIGALCMVHCYFPMLFVKSCIVMYRLVFSNIWKAFWAYQTVA